MKKKRELTREEHLVAAEESFKELPTTTRVRAWIFILKGVHYVILNYFSRLTGECIALYKSDKKGNKKGDPFFEISNSKDYKQGFKKALELLMPIEVEVEELMKCTRYIKEKEK